MKNLSSKIVLALSSVALMAAMSACTADSSAGTTDDMEELGWANPTGGDDAGDDPAEEPSEEEVESSTSEDVASSSSKAEEPESSDSEETPESSSSVVIETEVGVLDTAKTEVPPKVDSKKDAIVSVTPEKIEESMTKVDEDKLPEGITEDSKLEGDDLFVEEDQLDFDNNEYFCKTPEGDWYVLDGSKYDNIWVKIIDWLSWKFTGKKWLDYSKVCDVIYVHPNK